MNTRNPIRLERDQLLALLEQGEVPSQLLTLCELTGDLSPARRWSSYITGASPWEHRFPPDIAQQIRGQLATVLLTADPDAEPDTPLVDALIDHAIGSPIPPAEHPMLHKEMGLTEAGEVTWTAERPARAAAFKVVVIGAGLSGIAAARRFHRLGIDVEVIEKSDASGGTWHHNTYPGCGVDIASHYFSYSFARNPRWSRYYAKQPEILSYLRDCVTEEGLNDRISYNTEVLDASWQGQHQVWRVTTRTSDGEVRHVRANVVISAVGLLDRPSIPSFPGLADFGGPAFHAAEWDHSVSLDDKRVALIGTGASGNQIGPAIAPTVQHLTVFQRTAHWMAGVNNYALDVTDGEKWLLEHVPAYERWFRVRTLLSQNDTMRPAQVVDPSWDATDGSISAENAQMREELTQYIVDELGDRQDLLPQVLPGYPPFSKRMLRDNGWYRMLRRDNVALACSHNLRFESDAIIDDDGVRHPVDAAVFATGFEASKMLASFSLYGRDGASIRDAWGDDDPRAYLGVAVPGFPNFFIMYGPNTNIGSGGSIIAQTENWSRYIADLVKTMVEEDLAVAEVTQQACDTYNRSLDDRLSQMVWSVTPAGTWYRNAAGRVTTNMPWTSFEYWAMTQQVDLDAFDLTRANTTTLSQTALA
ncbi:flavin-containing monooxygenase [Leekyejoonella antrihumi]|uniref:NAD(P)/FAD-dependent oxidoreductase n=1 Tax=Leekyejoonella antrihumi TaxID=1660198 RepID=A0A563DSF0_9MICO|nr:NAD(P)/FAD-dependent oxidoreductase [Leekyejoonella antrihumi]TWP33170.1 NAD(P)/FAD-dependent oxidoreductase [Leekyejoonella antrihumi]